MTVTLSVPAKAQLQSLIDDTGPCNSLRQAAQRGDIELSALVCGNYPGRPFPQKWYPGLFSIGNWNCTTDQSWGTDWHRHDGLEIEFVESGQFDVGIGTETFRRVQPDQLAITRPWQLHRYGAPHVKTGRLHWLIFDIGANWPNQPWAKPDWLFLTDEDWALLSQYLRGNDTPVLNADKTVRKCFLKLAEIIPHIDEPLTVSHFTLALNELFLSLLKLLNREALPIASQMTTATRTVEMFLDSLRNNLSELQKPWTVKKMGRECSLGQTLFTDYCRRYTNKSPADYLKSLRLDAACQLLVTAPEITIAEISQVCGFGSARYFTDAFKKEYGNSPKEFRVG